MDWEPSPLPRPRLHHHPLPVALGNYTEKEEEQGGQEGMDEGDEILELRAEVGWGGVSDTSCA